MIAHYILNFKFRTRCNIPNVKMKSMKSYIVSHQPLNLCSTNKHNKFNIKMFTIKSMSSLETENKQNS